MSIEAQVYGPPDRVSVTGSASRSREQSFGGLHVVALVLAHARLFILMPILAALVTGVVIILLPKKYTTTVEFTPVSESISAGALASLAGQMGVALPGADPTSSPDFYAALVQTRALLQPLAEHKYKVRTGAGEANLSFIDLYGISEGSPGKTIDEALLKLRQKVLSVSFDRQTSIVIMAVTTHWSDLSLAMAQQLVQEIQQYDLHTRQTEGAAERDFLVERVDTARVELRHADDALRDFLVRNRAYQNDPSLLAEHDRLQREIGLRQDVYTSLVQSYEQARVTAVRNTPSLSFVQAPALALRFDRRHTLPKVLCAYIAMWILLLACILTADAFDEAKSSGNIEMETILALLNRTRRMVGKALRAGARSQ